MEEVNKKTRLSCARCGACSVVCPVYRAESRESLTARGKLHLLSLPLSDQPTPHFQDIFSRCLLCGACESVCSRQLPITELITRARGRFPLFYGRHGVRKALARKVLSTPTLLQGLVHAGISLQRIKALPAKSGLRIKLGLLEEPPVSTGVDALISHASDESDVSYFAGCLARHLQPSIAGAVNQLMGRAGLKVSEPEPQCCCGLAASAAGRSGEARELAWKNITSFATGKGPIVCSCASCSTHLAGYPDLFADDPERQRQAEAFSNRVVEFSSFVISRLTPTLRFSTNRAENVLYHDPCHLRFTPSGRENPRRLIDQISGLKRVEALDGPKCCGQGGLFHIGYPDLSRKIFHRCVHDSMAVFPALVVTTCSGCLMQWQQGVTENNLSLSVQHLAQLLVDCLE